MCAHIHLFVQLCIVIYKCRVTEIIIQPENYSAIACSTGAPSLSSLMTISCASFDFGVFPFFFAGALPIFFFPPAGGVLVGPAISLPFSLSSSPGGPGLAFILISNESALLTFGRSSLTVVISAAFAALGGAGVEDADADAVGSAPV